MSTAVQLIKVLKTNNSNNGIVQTTLFAINNMCTHADNNIETYVKTLF